MSISEIRESPAIFIDQILAVANAKDAVEKVRAEQAAIAAKAKR